MGLHPCTPLQAHPHSSLIRLLAIGAWVSFSTGVTHHDVLTCGLNYKFTVTRSDKEACEAVSELSWLAAYEAMSS